MPTLTASSAATHSETTSVLNFANAQWRVRRPRPFVLVIEGEVGHEGTEPTDYLHDKLLLPEWREAFYQLVDATGLVVCLNVHTQHPTYRDVRGRSSKGRLSQGEYYHHDGCTGPVKPRFVEIRCPIQPQTRGVATAVAPHHDVVKAMVQMLPAELAATSALAGQDMSLDTISQMDYAALDHLQGLITRTVRKKPTPTLNLGPWAKAASLPTPTVASPCNTAAPTKPHTPAAWPMATWSSAGPMKNCCYPAKWPTLP
jgi:hypothetical protein